MIKRGTIVEGSHNVFIVECEDSLVRRCAIKGKRLHPSARRIVSARSNAKSNCNSIAQSEESIETLHNALSPGDVVNVECDEADDNKGDMPRAMIVSALQRRNGFFRWNDKSNRRQILAANIDIVLLITTPASPPFRPRFIDRALMQCDVDALVPWIVCNKCDLAEVRDDNFRQRIDTWKAIGIQVFMVSAVSGSGLEQLREAIERSTRGAATPNTLPPTAVLVGQSGVGKSSIVNALAKNTNQRTGALCTKYDRGAHTTATGCMVHAKSMTGEIRLIDTPGVRQFVLHGITKEDAVLHFAEMLPLAGKCKYGMSCTHITEEGCAIREAVLKGSISKERYESYLRIRYEIP